MNFVDKFLNDDNTEIFIRENINVGSFICIGDSYAHDGQRDGNFVTGWITRLATMYNLTVGTNLFRSHEGASGWFHKGSGGHTFGEQFEVLLGTLTAEQKNDVKFILFCGGTNDVRYTEWDTTPYDAFLQISTLAKANCPNARVLIIPIGFSMESRARRVRFNEIYSQIKHACLLHKNIFYITNAWTPLHNKNYFVSDNVHLNNDGQRMITHNIANGLFGASGFYYERNDMTITWDGFKGNDEDSTTVGTRLNDNVLSVQFGWTNFNLAPPTPVENWQCGNSAHILGTFSCDTLPDNTNIQWPITGRVRDNDNKLYPFTGSINFANGNVAIICPVVNDAGTGWRTVTLKNIFLDMKQAVTGVDWI